MAERLLQHAVPLVVPEGTAYRAETWGEALEDGTWMGWLQFYPVDARGPEYQTERETTQPNREALLYWATGLEPVYLEGAYARAKRME